MVAAVALPMPFATGRSASTRWSGQATVTVSAVKGFTTAPPPPPAAPPPPVSDDGLLSRISIFPPNPKQSEMITGIFLQQGRLFVFFFE
jgi:hypothetical protein